MNKLFLNFICLIFLWSLATIAYASVSAETNRKVIALGETVNLNIRIKDENTNAKPDLDALNTHFNVINSSEQTQIQILNGKASSLKQWTITLEPKQTGPVTIPAIRVGDAYTEPLNIEITAANEFNNRGELKEIFISTFIEPENPYVSSQALYTVQVCYRTDIQSGQLTEPTVDEGTIKQIGTDSNYQKNLEGYTYHVLERRYAVVADKSGSLKIQPPVLTGYTRKNDTQSRNGMFHWINAMLEPLRVSANPTILDIKPMPEGITLAEWLPAKSFSIHEDWSVSASAFQLGQPITRTITMEATGITAEKLPEINQLDHPDLLIYPDKPQMENSSGEKELLAKRTEKLAIIPTKTGEIQLPQIDVKWWNIDQDRFEIASLPARTIQVTAPAAANPLHSSSSVSGSPSEIGQSREEENQLSNTPLLFKNERTIWISIVSALLLAWGLTLLFWRKNNQHPSEISSAPIQSARLISINELKKQFKSAALNNQPNQSRQALIEWAKWIWPSQDIRTLGDIEKCLYNPDTKELLRELDQCIYTNQSRHWNGKALWEQLEKEMGNFKKSGSKQSDELPSLYL